MTFFENIGRYFIMIAEMFKKPTKWSVMKHLILRDIDDLIIGSLGIVAFISFFVGGVISIQTALNISNPLIPKYLVGFATRQSVILEFAPTFTSIIMAGKVGSFITSSIGTMRVTEQIDALEVLGYNPLSYLVVPRVLAGALTFPVLAAFAVAAGLVAGWITSISLLDISTQEFVRGLRQYHRLFDVEFALIKSVSFGVAVTGIGCLFGYTAGGGAEGVGRSATRAVVVGCMMILVLDAFWALVLL